MRAAGGPRDEPVNAHCAGPKPGEPAAPYGLPGRRSGVHPGSRALDESVEGPQERRLSDTCVMDGLVGKLVAKPTPVFTVSVSATKPWLLMPARTCACVLQQSQLFQRSRHTICSARVKYARVECTYVWPRCVRCQPRLFEEEDCAGYEAWCLPRPRRWARQVACELLIVQQQSVLWGASKWGQRREARQTRVSDEFVGDKRVCSAVHTS